MREPGIEVLGVYRLPVTEELFREQFDILHGEQFEGLFGRMSKKKRAEAERQVREQLNSVVLIEAVVHERDDRFDVGEFTQPRDGVPKENWQAAYDEAFLSADGESLAVERGEPPPTPGDLRVAFYLHYWQPDKPLRSTYGDIACPPVEDMPGRLVRLVPYEPVD